MAGGDFYSDTVFITDVEGDAHPLNNIEVTVTKPGGGPAQIYSNQALSTVKPNQFVTDASGAVSFWAATGEYHITMVDLNPSPRISTYTVVWMSIPYDDFFAQLPAGMIWLSARPAAPTGWLICNGALVSRTQYATLFSAIGVSYGVGDGATTFGLPDYRGRVPVGLGTHSDVAALGQSEGVATVASRTPIHTHGLANHTHSLSNHTHSMQGHTHSMQGHTHTISADGVHTHGGGQTGTASGGVGESVEVRNDVPQRGIPDFPHHHAINADGNHSHGGTTGVSTGNTGSPSIGTTDVPSVGSTGAPSASLSDTQAVPYQVVNYVIKT